MHKANQLSYANQRQHIYRYNNITEFNAWDLLLFFPYKMDYRVSSMQFHRLTLVLESSHNQNL